MEIRMQVQGMDRLQDVLRKLGRWATPALGGALFRQGEGIMTKSKPQVPVLTGALKGSGHVQPPEHLGEQVSVTLGYGGPSAGYALAVHEGHKAFTVTPKRAKVLAVLARNWRGPAPNAYGSGMLPAFSKDGRFVIIGRRANIPATTGKKYLERPAAEAIPGMGERMATDLRVSIERTVR